MTKQTREQIELLKKVRKSIYDRRRNLERKQWVIAGYKRGWLNGMRQAELIIKGHIKKLKD